MKSNNVVEINGKLYDAKTGQPVDHSNKTVKPNTTQVHSRKNVDGFSRPSNSHSTVNQPVKVHLAATPEKRRSVARPETHRASRKVSKSLTLNRSSVKAPVIQVTASAPKEPPKQVVTTAMKHADSRRLERAQQITKSSAVAKFNHAPSVNSEAPTPVASTLTHHLKKTHLPATSTKPTASSHKESLVQHAVSKATVHHAVSKKQKKRQTQLGKFATTGFVALLLAGYVAYLNVPSISMKVAAHRAGFAATMPGYKPSGYSLKGPIAYSPGQVTVNFQSNTDERQFSLKQQPSTWDSTALLENFVVKQTANYLTYQDRGLTIFIYNGSNATWVNGGKLYNLQGDNAQLDTDQLLQLATSV